MPRFLVALALLAAGVAAALVVAGGSAAQSTGTDRYTTVDPPTTITTTTTVTRPPDPPRTVTIDPPRRVDVPRGSSPRLRPFPVVRVGGEVVGRWTRIERFSVFTPRGVTLDVRCRGRTCPFRARRTTVRSRRASTTVRVRALQRRLRAGVRVEVRVARRGRFGKYARLRLRTGDEPDRRDLCLTPQRAKVAPCPNR